MRKPLAIYIGSEERQVSVSSLVISDISLTRVEKRTRQHKRASLCTTSTGLLTAGPLPQQRLCYSGRHNDPHNRLRFLYAARPPSAAIEKGEGQNRFWKLILGTQIPRPASCYRRRVPRKVYNSPFRILNRRRVASFSLYTTASTSVITHFTAYGSANTACRISSNIIPTPHSCRSRVLRYLSPGLSPA